MQGDSLELGERPYYAPNNNEKVYVRTNVTRGITRNYGGIWRMGESNCRRLKTALYFMLFILLVLGVLYFGLKLAPWVSLF